MLEDERPRLDPEWQRQRKEIARIARAAAVAENIEVHQLLRGDLPHEQRARAVLCGGLAWFGWAPSAMERYLGLPHGSATQALILWRSQPGRGLAVVPPEQYDVEYEAWLGRMRAERARRRLRVVPNTFQRARPRPMPTAVRTWVDTGGNRNRLRSLEPSSAQTLTATIGELAGGLR